MDYLETTKGFTFLRLWAVVMLMIPAEGLVGNDPFF
jgi:hypothetical protein